MIKDNSLQGWNFVRLKDALILPLSYGLNESAEDDNPNNPRYIRITDFDDNDNLKDETFRSIAEDKAKEYYLKYGDILLARSGATVGKAFMYKGKNNKACYAGYLINARLNPQKVLPIFFSYVTKSTYFTNWRNRVLIKATIENISADKYNRFEYLVPPIAEQQSIANYLDTKCSKIDASVATLKEMKDKYLSLKKSLINETVCRGLNKNVPLKSSGIDWIGDIPEHWEVKRFKDYFRDYTTGMTPDSKNENFFSFDGDNTWVSIADLNSRYVNKSSINLSDLAVKAFSPIKVFKGALMFSFKLSIGKIGFATKDLYTNEAIASLHANSHWDLNYLYYILPKILFGNANENIYGAKMLNQKTMLQMLLIVPPIAEQQSIAKYLDTKCSKIDSIVANIDSQIEAYTKLKKSLISEVVTGKKRVI